MINPVVRLSDGEVALTAHLWAWPCFQPFLHPSRLYPMHANQFLRMNGPNNLPVYHYAQLYSVPFNFCLLLLRKVPVSLLLIVASQGLARLRFTPPLNHLSHASRGPLQILRLGLLTKISAAFSYPYPSPPPFPIPVIIETKPTIQKQSTPRRPNTTSRHHTRWAC